jgi:hypothetical protein
MALACTTAWGRACRICRSTGPLHRPGHHPECGARRADQALRGCAPRAVPSRDLNGGESLREQEAPARPGARRVGRLFGGRALSVVSAVGRLPGLMAAGVSGGVAAWPPGGAPWNSARNSCGPRPRQTPHGTDAVKAPPLENLPARRTLGLAGASCSRRLPPPFKSLDRPLGAPMTAGPRQPSETDTLERGPVCVGDPWTGKCDRRDRSPSWRLTPLQQLPPKLLRPSTAANAPRH